MLFCNRAGALSFVLIFTMANAAWAENEPITFNDIAAGDGAGITYRRGPSDGEAIIQQMRTQPIVSMQELTEAPAMGGGMAGVATADLDRDGFLDIYVTNGPGRANSLYLNNLKHFGGGSMTFTDVAEEMGCAATEQDSSGVVVGDIDNDGFKDILVLGARGHANRLYHNLGRKWGVFGPWLGFEEWTFKGDSQIAGGKDANGEYYNHTSATMADFNNDGLLDVAIATTWNQDDTTLPIFNAFHPVVHPNLLYINEGNGEFRDITSESGFDILEGFADREGPLQLGETFGYLHPHLYEAQATLPTEPTTISWAIAAVDFDMDGDVDIMHYDDQGGLYPAENGGVNQGLIQYFRNDGSVNGVPQFVNVTNETNANEPGAWMGSAYADFNHDGTLDLYATNFGAYGYDGFGPITHELQGNVESRAFFQDSDGTLIDGGYDDVIRSAFGWGTATADFDNDGDADVVYRGGLDVFSFIDMSNPNNFYLRNIDGTGQFEVELDAFANSDRLRIVQGLARGDLDRDGFVDVVTVSAQNANPAAPLFPYFFMQPIGAPLDAFNLPPEGASQFVWMVPINPEDPDPRNLLFAPIWPPEVQPLEGTLAVEMNGGNENNWLSVKLRGRAGIQGIFGTGTVNRDGIGAVVLCTPAGGRTSIYPVVAGDSFLSQSADEVYCGLGTADHASIEVRWPGGVTNRYHHVSANKRVILPEIPFDFDTQTLGQDLLAQILSQLKEDDS